MRDSLVVQEAACLCSEENCLWLRTNIHMALNSMRLSLLKITYETVSMFVLHVSLYLINQEMSIENVAVYSLS